MDVVDVAYNCGFFDQSHLNRCFKAMTTVTPYQYRVNFIQ
jgi:AraC-like DNA-binding protein